MSPRPRRGVARNILVLLALGAAAVAGVLFLSPLHRSDYLHRLARIGGRGGNHGALERVPGSRSPMPGSPGTPALPPPVAPATAVHSPLVPDAKGRLPVPLLDRVLGRQPADGVPAGWGVKEFAGRAEVDVVPTEIGAALRLRSEQSSFAVYRDVVVDAQRFPWLSWSWKVTRLPAGADVRQAATDDQAAQIYVIFPRWPAPLVKSDVIGYVWDTTAPVGSRLTSPKASNVRIIVVESGTAGVGTWRRQQRNVLQDYQALFGRRPPRLGTLAIMIDSDDTGGSAEALVGALAFSPAPS